MYLFQLCTFFLFALLYCCRCRVCLYHTVPRALELSNFCGSHGSAVAQQVCVDRLYACVGIADACAILCAMMR